MTRIKHIGIVANLTKKNAISIAKKVISILKSKNIKISLETSLAIALKQKPLGVDLKKMAKSVDSVVALGGDGTFLRVARVIENSLKPILGINLGQLGFLAEVTLDSIEKDLNLLIAGEYNIDYRMCLETEVAKSNAKKVRIQSSLNDVVVSKETIARIIDFDTYIDNKYVARYRADGIIVATPTGSTAYSLSAGGPIVYPESDVILIAPICPHTLNHRPLIIPSKAKIKIKLNHPVKDVVLTIDGQVGMKLDEKDTVIISKSSKKVPLITFKDTSYFNVLKQKLQWGSR